MAHVRRLRRVLGAAVALYAIGALLVLTQPPRFEVFPVFCWFLFPVSPTVEERWALRVAEVGGVRHDPPRFYEELGLTRDPWAMDAYVNVQRLGAALERGDTAGAARLRRRLEAHFLPPPTRYDVVKVRFEVLERWHEGTVRDEAVVARFETPAQAALARGTR